MASPDLDGHQPVGNPRRVLTRFSALALITGVICGLLAGVVTDHRLWALEKGIDELGGHVICKLPQPAGAAALRRAEKPYVFRDI